MARQNRSTARDEQHRQRQQLSPQPQRETFGSIVLAVTAVGLAAMLILIGVGVGAAMTLGWKIIVPVIGLPLIVGVLVHMAHLTHEERVERHREARPGEAPIGMDGPLGDGLDALG